MSNDTTTRYELTNTCTCTVYDPDTGEHTDEPVDYCFGDCWEFALEDFYQLNQEFIDSNETGWWKVTNLSLWSGNVSGYFYAKPTLSWYERTQSIVEGMTVRSEWTMRYTPYADRIEYSLSHHDSMGSATTLTSVTEDEREELGLY